jgi:hypothetical protein
MSRWAWATRLVLLLAGSSHAAWAEERWIDDERVLAARRIRLSAGFGVVRFDIPTLSGRSGSFLGSGMNLEEAAGLGHDLEAGARFGLRMSRRGQGLRADEVARTVDTETFGTGLSVTANPELRLRWRALRGVWGEAGLEDRVVLPILPDPDVTEVLGGWVSFRLEHVARVDMALNGVVTWQSFARERVLIASFGAPVQIWTQLTRGLFVGLISTLHSSAATTYTPSDTRWMAGLGLGYRVIACDLTETTYLLNLLDNIDIARILGAGLGVSCLI